MSTLPRGPFITTDENGEEHRMYVTINPDRRTTRWRRMKKDIAEQQAIKAQKEQINVKF